MEYIKTEIILSILLFMILISIQYTLNKILVEIKNMKSILVNINFKKDVSNKWILQFVFHKGVKLVVF